MFSQPRSRSTAISRNSFVYRLLGTRSFLSCKCAISVCLKIRGSVQEAKQRTTVETEEKKIRRMVGTGRFELPTPRTPSECSTRLSHVPTRKGKESAAASAADGV